MQRFSSPIPDKNIFDTYIQLKTVKHLLRLFSGLKAGQREIPTKQKYVHKQTIQNGVTKKRSIYKK